MCNNRKFSRWLLPAAAVLLAAPVWAALAQDPLGGAGADPANALSPVKPTNWPAANATDAPVNLAGPPPPRQSAANIYAVPSPAGLAASLGQAPRPVQGPTSTDLVPPGQLPRDFWLWSQVDQMIWVEARASVMAKVKEMEALAPAAPKGFAPPAAAGPAVPANLASTVLVDKSQKGSNSAAEDSNLPRVQKIYARKGASGMERVADVNLPIQGFRTVRAGDSLPGDLVVKSITAHDVIVASKALERTVSLPTVAPTVQPNSRETPVPPAALPQPPAAPAVPASVRQVNADGDLKQTANP
jgi:hypothetical protein